MLSIYNKAISLCNKFASEYMHFSEKMEIDKLFTFRGCCYKTYFRSSLCIHYLLCIFISDEGESGPFFIHSFNFPAYAFGLRNPNNQNAYINYNINNNYNNKMKFYIVTPGLTGQPGTISFKSTDPDRPNHYLRHRGYLLYLDPKSSTSLYKNDATFWLRPNKYFDVSILVKHFETTDKNSRTTKKQNICVGLVRHFH